MDNYYEADLVVLLEEAALILNIISENDKLKQLNEKEKRLLYLNSKKLYKSYWELANKLREKVPVNEMKFAYVRLIINDVLYIEELTELHSFSPLVKSVLPRSFLKNLKKLAQQAREIKNELFN